MYFIDNWLRLCYRPPQFPMSKPNREVIRRALEQKNDGILRIVSGFTKSVSGGPRTIRAVLSSETVDRYGDIIRAAAFNTPRNFKNYFESNPILLWAHGRDCNLGDLPIGSIKSPAFNGTDMNGKPAFEGDVCFADTVEAEPIWKLYEQECLRAFSVGFRPVTVKQQSEDQECTGYEFLEVDLLENSAVPIPANPAALRKAFASGTVDEEFIVKSFFPLRDNIVKHSDIFLPTNWNYKASLNELALLREEWKDGRLKREVPVQAIEEKIEEARPVEKKNEPVLTDYKCEFCLKSSKYEFEKFAMKEFHGISYNDVECSHCNATMSQCLELTELLLQQS